MLQISLNPQRREHMVADADFKADHAAEIAARTNCPPVVSRLAAKERGRHD
jgi:hypothetical protein